ADRTESPCAGLFAGSIDPGTPPGMLTNLIVRLVELCTKRAWWAIALALLLSAGAANYAVRHFAVHTDIRELISPDLPWSQRALQYMKAFPQPDIIVVVDGPTSEFAEQAADELARALQQQPETFRSVSHPGSGSFFEQNGLLFLG